MTGHRSRSARGGTCPPAARGRGSLGLQIMGELLVTAGVVAVLFVVWQLWWTNLEASTAQDQAVAQLARDFTGPVQPARGPAATDHGEPVSAGAPGYGQPFGIVYIPRFGPDYSRPLAEGTGADVLDTLGLGHYEATAMPGQIGNVAVAGHRQTNGKVLDRIHTLQAGDHIHVRTAAGYYTYGVTGHEIVTPDQTRVIAPDPEDPTAAPTRRLLTLTSCHPRYGDTERYIVHAEQVSWRPAQAGPPAEIAAAVAADTKGT